MSAATSCRRRWPTTRRRVRRIRRRVVGPRPVALRTLDVGGDKLPEALAHHAAADSANPALGLRAIRLSLKERRLLDTQLAAMLRAAVYGPLRILLPMICNVGE